MWSVLTVVVVLFSTSCSLNGYLAEEHLVPKSGLEPRHSISKRDVSESDLEIILKTLMSKLNLKPVDTELMHKGVGVESGHYSYEPERAGKVHYADMEEGGPQYTSKAYPVEYEHTKETYPHQKSNYEIGKGVGNVVKDMMALSTKLKELGIGEDTVQSHGKDVYPETPEEKFVTEKMHFPTDPVGMEHSTKVFGDVLKDQFSDKEVSKAESLYHMKIAGDIETYPSIKMEPLYNMKMADEKLYHGKEGDEESYLKKFDEMGKTLLKEEPLKDGDIEAYLKKVANEEKPFFYEPKIAHSEGSIKTAEEKALEAWKDSHKDVFVAESGLDEKFIKESDHHMEEGISHGISEELIKKLKALGLDKEQDEILRTLSEEFHKEGEAAGGSFAYEKAKDQARKDAHSHLNDEEMKKHIDESFAFGAKETHPGTDLLFEKGLSEGKMHGISTKIGAGIDKSIHGVIGEDVFKSKEAHELDEAYRIGMDEVKFGKKIPLMEGEFKHGMSHDIAAEFAAEAGKTFKAHEEDLFKQKDFGSDALLHKYHEEDLLKQKGIGTDSLLHKAHEEELLKQKGFGSDALLHKAHEEDLLKQKALSSDAFLHKAHEEELLKQKGFGSDEFLHKALEGDVLKEKSFDIDALLHKVQEEILRKEKADSADAFLHKSHEGEVLGREKSFGADGFLHKPQVDEHIKKEIAYGPDALFHNDKDILVAADEHQLHEEKSHKSIHDLKAKFFELLRRVLRTRKCHLVTMRPGELLGIVNCVSRSKDPLVCEKFSICEKKMPPRVIAALEKCQKDIIPGEAKRCTRYAPLYPSTEIPLKIFQCVAVNTRELIHEEKKMMIDFEECARLVKAESCARFRFLPH